MFSLESESISWRFLASLLLGGITAGVPEGLIVGVPVPAQDGFGGIPAQLGYSDAKLKTGPLDQKSIALLNLELAERIEALRVLRAEAAR